MTTNNLNEALAEIQKSKKSTAEKKSLCIKLGLRPRDVEYLEYIGFFDGKTFTFGVEIECFADPSRVHLNARLNNLEIRYEGYNHRDNDHYYKFVSDSSVNGLPNPIECVSPILQDAQEGHESLKNCLKTLNDSEARVNSSCGLHVHVGAERLTDEAYVNVFKNYQALELLIDSFMAPSRRGDCTWAHSIRRFDYSACSTKDTVRRLMGGRYYKVNPVAYSAHRTIEFRQHQGSVSYEKISMWVNFCIKLVAWSETNVLSGPVSSVSEIPFLDEDEKRFFESRRNHFMGA